MDFRCPFCDYENDSRKGVEAHISGKSDSIHKGKVGRAYRSEIEQESEPDGILGRVRQKVGESPQIQSLLEEVRRIRQSHREDIDELEERVDEIEEELERRRGLKRQVERMEKEQIGAITVLIEDVNALNTVVRPELEGESVCPRCGLKVSFRRNSEWEPWRCENCRYEPLEALEKAISNDPDQTPVAWEEMDSSTVRGSPTIPSEWVPAEGDDLL